MEIELQRIKVSEVCEGYADNDEEGVFGYHGKLNIRPPFQREFVYKDKQRDAVIETVMKGFPLNTIYWSVNAADNTFELLDGQQRTLSLCQYKAGDFSVNGRYYHNLPQDEQQKFLDYELMVYVCKGTDSEKLSWFKIINIAGEKLTDQELRNAVYAGSWLADAKRHFSKTQCPAYRIASNYMNGSPIRQEYLETALDWLTEDSIEEYMAAHQHDPNANELWLYFQKVISWVETIFPTYRKEMKGLPWGKLYNDFKDDDLDTAKLDKEVAALMQDEDVTRKAGIYLYVLTRDERWLNIRAFLPHDKRTAYERQKGKCAKCGKQCSIDDMEADHITPWSKGGKTLPDNCQMLCKDCNRRKSDV